MTLNESVTLWLRALREGNEEAAKHFFSRYFEEVTRLARKQLGNSPRRVADEEDVAQSVMRYVYDGAKRGSLDKVNDRDELWKLLVKVTVHKVIDQRRYLNPAKRGGGKVRGESVFLDSKADSERAGLDGMEGTDPNPEFLALAAEQHEYLLDLLQDDVLRQVVLGKLDGMNNEQIALELGITSRSVRRKLARIREIWQGELDDRSEMD